MHCCGDKGHKEALCFKKNPEKAAAWQKEKHEKAEMPTSSAKVSLKTLGNIKPDGVDLATT